MKGSSAICSRSATEAVERQVKALPVAVAHDRDRIRLSTDDRGGDGTTLSIGQGPVDRKDDGFALHRHRHGDFGIFFTLSEAGSVQSPQPGRKTVPCKGGSEQQAGWAGSHERDLSKTSPISQPEPFTASGLRGIFSTRPIPPRSERRRRSGVSIEFHQFRRNTALPMPQPVELSRQFLSDTGGWKEMKEARAIHAAGGSARPRIATGSSRPRCGKG